MSPQKIMPRLCEIEPGVETLIKILLEELCAFRRLARSGANFAFDCFTFAL
jgi:hypothetical protein